MKEKRGGGGMVTALLGAICGGILALAGVYLTHCLDMRRSAKQERHRLYWQLTGLRAALYHHAGLHGDAAIRCRYYGALARSTAEEPRHTDYDEKRQLWQDTANAAVTVCVDIYVRLMETVGGIHVHFDRTDELDSLTQPLSDMKFSRVGPPESPASDNMDTWKEEQERRLEAYLCDRVTGPIDALLAHLRDRLAED